MNKTSITAAVFLVAFSPLFAQVERGVKFQNDLSWQKVKDKAQAENKYIFVDCFTSWCGPCKEMDKNVFPSAKVGTYLNNKFISVRIQMDRPKKGKEQSQSWQQTADTFLAKYNILAYPSFLFFSPTGELVHRDIGYRDVDNFIELAAEAIDPRKQYYTLLNAYREGKKVYSTLAYLALSTKKLGDKELSNRIAEDYKHNYLDNLDDSSLFTKGNIYFACWEFPDLLVEEGSKGRIFWMFYNNKELADSIMDRKGFADSYVNYIISKEEIENKLWENDNPVTTNPDWTNIENTLSNKYPKLDAPGIVLAYKLSFYSRIKNWKQYSRLRNEKIHKSPPKPGGGLEGDTWALNTDAWNVFLYCLDTSVLSQALGWIELAINIENDPFLYVQYYDTKANLLYKLGQINDAILWEVKALKIDSSNAQKLNLDKGYLYDEYNSNLIKMKKGVPTWKQQ